MTPCWSVRPHNMPQVAVKILKSSTISVHQGGIFLFVFFSSSPPSVWFHQRHITFTTGIHSCFKTTIPLAIHFHKNWHLRGWSHCLSSAVCCHDTSASAVCIPGTPTWYTLTQESNTTFFRLENTSLKAQPGNSIVPLRAVFSFMCQNQHGLQAGHSDVSEQAAETVQLWFSWNTAKGLHPSSHMSCVLGNTCWLKMLEYVFGTVPVPSELSVHY